MSSLTHRRCSAEGCESKNYSRGFCYRHHRAATASGELPPLLQKSFEQRFWEAVDKNGPLHPVLRTRCWVWTAHKNAKGYGSFSRDGKELLTHRASWLINRGDIPAGLFVLHKCDNPSCVRPDHLFLGTIKDNVRDMMEKGRKPKVLGLSGELNPMAVLSAETVAEARRLGKSGKLTLTALSERFGVEPGTLHLALIGKTWRSVSEPPVAPGTLPKGRRRSLTG